MTDLAFSILLSEVEMSGIDRNYIQSVKKMELSRSIASLFGGVVGGNNDFVQILSMKEINNTSSSKQTVSVQFSISITRAILAVLEGSRGVFSHGFTQSLSEDTVSEEDSSNTVVRDVNLLRSSLQHQHLSESENIDRDKILNSQHRSQDIISKTIDIASAFPSRVPVTSHTSTRHYNTVPKTSSTRTNSNPTNPTIYPILKPSYISSVNPSTYTLTLNTKSSSGTKKISLISARETTADSKGSSILPIIPTSNPSAEPIALATIEPTSYISVQNQAICEFVLATTVTSVFPEWKCIQNIPKTDPCAWNGVLCDGLVINNIILSYKSLSGTIPTSIGMISSLQILLLLGNSLYGRIPSSIGFLSSLQSLSLSLNQLSGIIPSSIGLMTSLRFLSLSHNHLSSSIPSSIGLMSSLNHLRLSVNHLTGILPSSIGLISSLLLMYLSSNLLSSIIPSTIVFMTSLNFLYLSNNLLTGSLPRSIGLMTSLKHWTKSEVGMLNETGFGKFSKR